MQNISFETLYGGQFMLSIELIKPNYPNLTAPLHFYHSKRKSVLIVANGARTYSSFHSLQSRQNFGKQVRSIFLAKNYGFHL